MNIRHPFLPSRTALAAVATLAILPGCPSNDGGVQNSNVIGSVEVTPNNATVVLGGPTQLIAVPRTVDGAVVPGQPVTWSSTDPGVVSVSGSGLVTGVAEGGPVQVRATVNGVTGLASVTVQSVPIMRVGVTPAHSPLTVGTSVQLTATPYDANDAPITGRSVRWESSAPGIASVSSTGLVTGQAPGGPVTITARIGEKSGTATVDVQPRPATQLAFTQQPGPAAAGAPLSPALLIALQDDLLATVTGESNPVTIALAANPGAATLGGTLTVTPVNGIATFGDLTLNKAGTGYTLLVTSPGLQPATSAPFNVAPAPAAQLTFTAAPPGTGRIGVPLAPQPAVQLRDAHGNMIQQAGVQVTASVVSGTGSLSGTTTVSTDPAGIARFSNLVITGTAGSYGLGFGAPGLATLLSGPIVLSAGNAWILSITTQPSGSVQSAVPFAQQPVLQLRDVGGNPVARAGVVVVASLATGTGTLGGQITVTTTGSGVATFTSLAINGGPGLYSLRFGTPGEIRPVVSGPITLGAGTATQIGVTVQPSASAQSGAPFGQQPVIQLQDPAGNPVSQAGVVVTAAIGSGGGTLSGTLTATTGTNGQATFTNLAISGSPGARTLSFSAPGVASVISATITITPGALSRLTITTQPSTAASGVVFAPQPAVQLRDAAGNPVSQAGVVVTATIASGGGTLSGTLTATTGTGGQATFTDLAISGSIGARTLSFSAPGVASVNSATITITPGAPTGLTMTTQPAASAGTGAVFAPQPVVQLRDAAGNAVSQAGVNVSAAITAGGQPALSGTATVATNAGGAAVFTNLAITGVVGSRTLRFSSGTLTPVVSSAIAITAGVASRLFLSTQPSATATTGYAFAQQPVIQLRDAGNNLVAQGGVVISAAVTSGTATLSGGLTAMTNGAGAASFTNLALTGPPASYSLSFTSGSLTAATSSAIALSSDTLANKLFTPNAVTISTSEGAPYADSDLWNGLEYSQSRYGYGPTKVVRLYICLSAKVETGLCSFATPPTGPLSASMLSDIEAGIASYAGTGIRLLIRFIYNFGPIGPGARDVPASLITTHIDQLAPLLLRQKDHIFALEAGFIGTWGEWHSSTSGNDTPAARALVLDRELFHFRNVFPILVRYPAYLLTYTGSSIPAPELGLHDDYFASDPSDGGTWLPRDGHSTQTLIDYAKAVSASSMFAGEFGALYPPLQACSALNDYAHSFNLQSVSLFIWPPEVATAIENQGCLLSFLSKVGTRVEAQRLVVTGNPVPGGTLHLAVTMANTGYGRVIRARPATVVLTSGATVVQQTPIPLGQMDLRLLASAITPVSRTFEFDVTLPAVLPANPLTLSLLVPDPAPSLVSSAAYALPLNSLAAGSPIFNPVTGRNTLATFTTHFASLRVAARPAPGIPGVQR